MNFNLIRERFNLYLQSLDITEDFLHEHVYFKVEHTYRVIANSIYLANHIGLSQEETSLAKIIALLHDIGRFSQFLKYRTFDDSISVNHAELGVNIIKERGILKENVNGIDELLIIRSILNHNLPRLNGEADDRILLFSKIIRDADKMDIWKILSLQNVVHKILTNEIKDPSYAIPNVIQDCFRNGQTVPSGSARSMNDYRLLRLSWIFDMNFVATYQWIIKHGLVDEILAKIPYSPEKEEITSIIHACLKDKSIA